MKIPVIIINYKTPHLMRGLINSIDEEEIEVSIIIVDNASTDESYDELQLIASTDERIHILKSKKNLGFTGGINFALNYLLNHLPDSKYFFLLNPDAFSIPNLIGDLAKILAANGNAVCVSPKISYLNGTPWYSGALINFTQGKVINNPTNKLVDRDYYEVDVFSGCASVFQLDKVIKTGMFNEALFMYFDEADFSIKLKKSGFKLLYSPKHQIQHDVSYSTRDNSHLKTYYMTRNKFIVFNNYMGLFYKVYFILHEFAFHIKNGRFINAFFHLKGFIDFKKGKLGQLETGRKNVIKI